MNDYSQLGEQMNEHTHSISVTVRCYTCEHIHKVFTYVDLGVFIPQTLKHWAELECPACHSVGHEILVALVEPEVAQ